MELILTDIELNDNLTNENTFDVWYKDNIFVAIENVKGGRTFRYQLTNTLDYISNNHRDEILSYRLGRYTKDDEVSIGDVFMFGKFIYPIK